MRMAPSLMSSHEVCRFLEVPDSTVWRLAAVGKIRAVERTGRPICFDRASVERFKAAEAQARPAVRRRTRPAAVAGK
jgi:excisionase family DNA binding protein